jgi:PAS domain S-box-containing protein
LFVPNDCLWGKEGADLKVLLLLTEDKTLQNEIKELIPNHYFLVESDDDAFDWINFSDLQRGLVLLDLDYPGVLDWLQEARIKRPDLVCVGLGKTNKQALSLANHLYDYLILPFESWQLEKVLDRAWGKTLENYKDPGSVNNHKTVNVIHQQNEFDARPWARVISDFSRTVSNQLNRDKFLNLFLYAVKELMPVGKLSILLKDKDSEEYFIAAEHGLNPDLKKRFRLSCSDGIIAWLSEEGQILQRLTVPDNIPTEQKAEMQLEMKLLHAFVCVPLIAYGKMNGVLCLGSKVAGTPFHDKELELIYAVCGNIAIALEDINLHELLLNQKIYIESILQRMNSGVIAIDQSEKITTFNQRAGEILSREPLDIMSKDLRQLVSPLGDMLYETLIKGTEYNKKQVELAGHQLPLEVSTYRMINQFNEILGSVMIVDDISARKKAESEKNKAEQINVLNRFVSQLTHEIKNPMVAIQTFAQLLPEKYEDSDFRNTFSQTVKQEIKRLNELIDQLIAFSTPLHYCFEIADIKDVLEYALELLDEQGVEIANLIRRSYCQETLRAKVDRLSLARAFSYLINFLSETDQKNGKEIIVVTALSEPKAEFGQIQIMITDNVTKVEFEDPEMIFNPLEICPESPISIGLPVSRKIIEDHGGRLHAVQSSGNTLKFGINLPALD